MRREDNSQRGTGDNCSGGQQVPTAHFLSKQHGCPQDVCYQRQRSVHSIDLETQERPNDTREAQQHSVRQMPERQNRRNCPQLQTKIQAAEELSADKPRQQDLPNSLLCVISFLFVRCSSIRSCLVEEFLLALTISSGIVGRGNW